MKNEYEIKLSETLLSLIKSHNSGINRIARELDISQSLISDWCNGVIPSGKSLCKLKKAAEYFDVTLEFLLFGKDASLKSKAILCTEFIDEGIVYQLLVRKQQQRK